MRVGFIGLGNIGAPIARRLVQAGLDPLVFDQDEAAVRALVDAGARGASSCADVAAQSDCTGVCVRDDADVIDVMLGEGGVVDAAASGSVIALHSTILPATVLRVADTAAERGVGVVDATVTGGAMGAERGQLTYMAGGDAELVDRCRPVFEASAASVVHTGPLGTGAAMKLCLAVVTYLGFLAQAEATTLARRTGLSLEAFEEVLGSTGALTDQLRAFVRMRWSADERADDEAVQSALRNFAQLGDKDLTLALALAREQEVRLRGAALAQELMAYIYGVRESARD